MATSHNPYQADPNVSSVKRVTCYPVVILSVVFVGAVGAVYWYKSQGARLLSEEDAFAASRNKPAIESANMIISESSRDVSGAAVGAVAPDESNDQDKEASARRVLSEMTGASHQIRARAKASALRDDDRDARSLSASSVVAIPNRNAAQARNAGMGLRSTYHELSGGASPRASALDALSALSGREGDPNMQDKKQEFLSRTKTDSFVLPHEVEPPRERELKTGSLIPATLMTAINSDLPGALTAQVAAHVYDTATGEAVLIPQGSRLFGNYDSQVAFGQSRVLAAWQRIVFPDGRSLNLETMGGSDGAGRGGFADEVDRHYPRIFGSALLMSILSAGVQLSQPQARAFDNVSSQQLIAANMGLQMGQTGMEVTRRNLNVQPTIKIRPGYRFTVIVNKDFVVPEDEER